jgi:hypothetical protein
MKTWKKGDWTYQPIGRVLETLKTSEEKYHEIVENTSDVVHTTDNKGNLLTLIQLVKN